jgi:hypothetical protein
MRQFILILLLLFIVASTKGIAQQGKIEQKESPIVADKLTVLKFDIKAVPKNLQYKGKIVMGARWIDKKGENILILTQTGAFPSTSKSKCITDECFDAEIYAYNFVQNADNLSLLWKIVDSERNCPFDLYAGFLEGALFITDLDSNGLAESTLLYILSCRSDVSPATLKLIMHEGASKYAIRGTTKLQEGYGGGEMHVDPSLKKTKQVFQTFAIKKWHDYETKDSFKQF